MRDLSKQPRLARLARSLGANLVNQGLTAAIQIISIPLFLHMWTIQKYGTWLLLSAAPGYFALADFGFISVSINKMTMLVSGGNHEGALVVFHTIFKLVCVVVVAAIVIATTLVFPIAGNTLGPTENKITFIFLITAAMLAMAGGLFDAIFRSSERYATGVLLNTTSRLIEWCGLITALLIYKSFVASAAGMLIGRSIATLGTYAYARKIAPYFSFSFSKGSANEMRELALPALSFMAFPAANAISLQGMTLLVGNIYGTAFLAVFSTYRTLARVLVQVVTTLSRSLWAEISMLYGKGDHAAIRQVYRKGTLGSIVTVLLCSLILAVIGRPLLNYWTHGRIEFRPTLFFAFLFTCVLTSFWQTGMTVLSATNHHIRLSRDMLLSALAGITVAFFASKFYSGAPLLGLIVTEVIMIISTRIHIRQFFRDIRC